MGVFLGYALQNSKLLHDATTERDSLSSGRNSNVHAAGKDSYILSLPSQIRKDSGFGMSKTVEDFGRQHNNNSSCCCSSESYDAL